MILSPGEALAFFIDGALCEPDPNRLTAEAALANVLAERRGAEAGELARAVEELAIGRRHPGREDDIAVVVARAT